jgi:hypothetical protein
MKTDRYTLLRRPWRLPVALPDDPVRGTSARLVRGVKERPPEIFPPRADSARPLAEPLNRATARAASHLRVAPR